MAFHYGAVVMSPGVMISPACSGRHFSPDLLRVGVVCFAHLRRNIGGCGGGEIRHFSVSRRGLFCKRSVLKCRPLYSVFKLSEWFLYVRLCAILNCSLLLVIFLYYFMRKWHILVRAIVFESACVYEMARHALTLQVIFYWCCFNI
jgi:hypothetical protein